MPFVKTQWNDDALPDITAAQLNRQEKGIADAHAWIADPWHNIGAAGEPAFLNSWVNIGGANEVAAFRFILPGVVGFKGSIKGGNYGTVVCNIPAAYRPALPRRLTINCLDSGTRRVALLYVDAAGAVYVFSETGAPNPSSEADMEAVMVL